MALSYILTEAECNSNENDDISMCKCHGSGKTDYYCIFEKNMDIEFCEHLILRKGENVVAVTNENGCLANVAAYSEKCSISKKEWYDSCRNLFEKIRNE